MRSKLTRRRKPATGSTEASHPLDRLLRQAIRAAQAASDRPTANWLKRLRKGERAHGQQGSERKEV
jgi:hypothetical protein